GDKHTFGVFQPFALRVHAERARRCGRFGHSSFAAGVDAFGFADHTAFAVVAFFSAVFAFFELRLGEDIAGAAGGKRDRERDRAERIGADFLGGKHRRVPRPRLGLSFGQGSSDRPGRAVADVFFAGGVAFDFDLDAAAGAAAAVGAFGL